MNLLRRLFRCFRPAKPEPRPGLCRRITLSLTFDIDRPVAPDYALRLARICHDRMNLSLVGLCRKQDLPANWLDDPRVDRDDPPCLGEHYTVRVELGLD